MHACFPMPWRSPKLWRQKIKVMPFKIETARKLFMAIAGSQDMNGKRILTKDDAVEIGFKNGNKGGLREN